MHCDIHDVAPAEKNGLIFRCHEPAKKINVDEVEPGAEFLVESIFVSNRWIARQFEEQDFAGLCFLRINEFKMLVVLAGPGSIRRAQELQKNT